MKTINVKLEGKHLKVPESTSPLALVAERMDPSLGLDRPIGAIIDNRLVSLDTPLSDGAEIRLVGLDTESGVEIYRRGAILMLVEAVRREFPGARLVVGQSLGDGTYFEWTGEGKPDESAIEKIEASMRKMAGEDTPFERERVGVPEALRRFRALGLEDRVTLLECFWHENIRLVKLGGTIDILHGPFPPSTGLVTEFRVEPYHNGLVLRLPLKNDSSNLAKPLGTQEKLFSIHHETKNMIRRHGVSNVGELNRLCIHGGIRQLIRVAEGYHEKRIAEIADRIYQNREKVRLVLIAGPSCSGKTTFLKRLSVQLEVNGLKPVGLSIDNYYVNREDTPRDEEGKYDFEAIEAIDLELFNEQLVELLDGKLVHTPRFNFNTGKRVPREKWVPMQLRPCDILVVEGIHGLNDRLTSQVPQENKFKLYVSALTQLCLDDTNRIHTTDARLLRRIVRDRLYRGYDAAATLQGWPSVRRGERRNIYPFQESADEMFNSALPYETAVLKVYAERFLLEVPQDHPAYPEVHRLMKFLSLFVGIFPDAVPQNSILREFIGGSTFHY
ncbi:MAG: nucleoside kinase [Deltaproteobacteria bacterium]|nr:MAG: nucleoside kinase [Deltaproteobacteria bacterium]